MKENRFYIIMVLYKYGIPMYLARHIVNTYIPRMFYTLDELKEAVKVIDNDRYYGIEIYGSLNDWIISKSITSFNHLFYRCTKFNEPINKWKKYAFSILSSSII
jgi:hypothetical protein